METALSSEKFLYKLHGIMLLNLLNYIDVDALIQNGVQKWLLKIKLKTCMRR